MISGIFFIFKSRGEVALISDIVPFVATPLKGRFVVFLKWLLIGYFRLGKVILG